MSEILSKTTTAEMKRSGSKKERLAAVSVQAGRMADKLLQRSRDLKHNSVETPSNAQAKVTSFEGAPEGDKAYSERSHLLDSGEPGYFARDTESTELTSSEKTVKPFLRKPRQEKTVNITRRKKEILGSGSSGSVQDHIYELEIDPEGKKKPVVYTTDTYHGGRQATYEGEYTPSAEGLVDVAAPELYEIKKGIDKAGAEQARKAA